MKTVYLDNAATTAVREEVIDTMTQVLRDNFGNASSTYSIGRSSKAIIETSRKQIAKILNVSSSEIIFTSSATEANNWVLRNAVEHLQVKRIITTKIEHHAVLNTVLALEKQYGIEVVFLDLDAKGHIAMHQLEDYLRELKPTLVSLMHVNNEIGTVLDIKVVAELVKSYNAYFHSDTVQSVGKLPLDLQEIKADFILGTAHKFHGPKGIGFVYIRKGVRFKPLFFGGEQEKGIRPSTESVHQIAGLAKALELASANLEADQKYITELRNYLCEQLDLYFPGYKVNGDKEGGIYNIISIQLPLSHTLTSTILFSLDLKGIFLSRGSACQSGSMLPSHVLKEILPESELNAPSFRVSFSHYNTKEDIDILIQALQSFQ